MYYYKNSELYKYIYKVKNINFIMGAVTNIIIIILLLSAGYYAYTHYDSIKIFIDKIEDKIKNAPTVDINLINKTNFTAVASNNTIVSNFSINSDIIKIATWNMQIFGDSKANNQELMNAYVDKISNYDIFFIQEIRDSDGSAFDKLCSMLPAYNCKESSRAGRSTSKEQYGAIYKKEITLQDFKDYNPDELDRFERPPALFKFNNINFVIIHTKPDDVENEMNNLEDIIGSSDYILAGDLNADCDYYNNDQSEFANYNWIIKDSEDTTVSATNCAYDRYITTKDIEIKAYGIDKEITEDMSDHYIIWMNLVK